MKKLFRHAFLPALLFLSLTSFTRADVIAWKAPADIQGDSDISTTGTSVDAIQGYGGPNVQGSGKAAAPIKIGDTLFNPIHGSDRTYGDETISFTAGSKALFYNSRSATPLPINTAPIASNEFNAIPPSAHLSADYSTVVSNGVFYNWGAVGSITLSGLTAGKIYQIQIWGFVQDGRRSTESFSDEYDNTAVIDAAAHVPKSGSLTPGNPYGQYVIGSFRAKGSTATLDWTFGDGSYYGAFSAIALRDVSNDSDAKQSVAKAEAAAKAIADGTAPATPPLTMSPGINVWKNVRYVRIENHSLKVDIIVPQNPPGDASPVPLVVYIHGGGWSALDKTEGFGNFLLQHHFALACVEYRFPQEAIFPAQLYDCKAAIRWLRQHAKQFGYSADKIGALGDSAGGHLVSMLGVTNNNPNFEGKEGASGESSSVQAVADYFGPTNLQFMDTNVAGGAVPRLLGGMPSQHVEAAKNASPIVFVGPDSSPFVIVQGDEDPIVNPQQSITFYDALHKAGVDSTLYLIKGGKHGVNDDHARDLCVALFNKYLR